MRIKRVDDALNLCEEHLYPADTMDREVENLLVQSLLILICAEFEKKFQDLVLERCSSVSDGAVKEYIQSYTRTILRSLRLDAISDLLRRFGTLQRETFKKLRDENRKADAMYSNIVINRNAVAHGKGSSVTFGDLKQYYEEGHVMLDYFHDALWNTKTGALRPADTVENNCV